MTAIKGLGSLARPATVPFLDYGKKTGADAIYVPETKIYHQLSICVGNSASSSSNTNQSPIGRVQSFQPDASTRTVTPKYELGNGSFGRPVDNIPGRAEGYTISMARVELWENEIELALGYGDVFSDLMDMRWSVDLYEMLYKGPNLYRCWRYVSCWMSSLAGAEYSADGDGIITATANFTYLFRQKLDTK